MKERRMTMSKVISSYVTFITDNEKEDEFVSIEPGSQVWTYECNDHVHTGTYNFVGSRRKRKGIVYEFVTVPIDLLRECFAMLGYEIVETSMFAEPGLKTT